MKDKGIEAIRRAPAEVTNAALEAAALRYIGRYASSAEQLRRVLLRRVGRSTQIHGTDPDAFRTVIEALILRFEAMGYLDDARFADTKAASLQRRGRSLQAIHAALYAKGLGRPLIDEALREAQARGGDLAAAIALVRRRRLGPYRDEALRAAHREKDLAILARAGFDRQTALRVLACPDQDSLNDLFDEISGAES